MSNIPENLLYTQSHEWVRQEDDGSLTVGVTDHAQHLLGDLVFVELPPEDDLEIAKGEECCVLESVKAASDVYAPLSGVISEVNEALSDAPEAVNESPYESGWLFKMTSSDESELAELMDAAAYEECVKAETH